MLNNAQGIVQHTFLIMFRTIVSSLCVLLIYKKCLWANETEVYTINTKGCFIRGYPLISQSIEHIVGVPKVTDDCSTKKHFIFSNSTHIWIDDDYLDNFQFIVNRKELSCCYRSFKSEDVLQNIIYSICSYFSTIIEVKHDFVRVECYYADDKVYDDFLTFLPFNYVPGNKNSDRFNVLIIGLESMSRLNFHRTMPKTFEYLRQKGSIELQGYNKLGDNSYPNLFPMLMGKSYDHVKRNCIEYNSINELKCPFIWKKYKDSGYRTALASDSMAGFLGEYEYNLTKIPTDFYLQPFMFESRQVFTNQHYAYHQCLNHKYFYKILLNYIDDITSLLQKDNLFGIFWEESISHEDLNRPHKMDEDYLNLLMNFEATSYLNNTVLIFLSDHGIRWGDIVRTEQGRQEERLPLLQFLFPESFKQRFVAAFKYFQSNSQRLVTPFDVYETLKDLNNIKKLRTKTETSKKSQKNKKKSSLFLPVTRRRTCESVGIDDHWCTCDKGHRLKVGDLTRIHAANVIIAHVNELLKSYPQCKQIGIGKILHATLVKNSDFRLYNIIIETIPGEAILDGTVKLRNGKWTVSGTVSRLNLYRKYSCINNDVIKAYCFC